MKTKTNDDTQEVAPVVVGAIVERPAPTTVTVENVCGAPVRLGGLGEFQPGERRTVERRIANQLGHLFRVVEE